MKNASNGASRSAAIIDITEPGADAAAELGVLFVESLKDIYWAENALISALPRMAANSTSQQLRSVINEHIEITKIQVGRLESVFELLGSKAEGKKCEAMSGLIKEGESILAETVPGPVRDAAIIASSQKIEHYEIATYGTLCAFARALGENEACKLLMQTLAEEKEADCLLSDTAFSAVNMEAAEIGDTDAPAKARKRGSKK
ncbi:MAG: hypothetical protein BGO88_08420 [Flavobacterium sp. 38-13]|uniref:YciE/YciF ferroxidase family protein n=1 Tax=Flavobacterium sp. 38-13 TaxID=1896168 RepID=UPI00095A9B73|nr:ferritin-like domain-containing protein [Flavobacterium sp. 38-13]OJX49770.1 MAG: hypothetical protein BGO88_08420 [Flavobacterium sp. 38-13]